MKKTNNNLVISNEDVHKPNEGLKILIKQKIKEAKEMQKRMLALQKEVANCNLKDWDVKNNIRISFVSTMNRRNSPKHCDLENQIIEKINLLLGINCRLINLVDSHIIEVSSKTSYKEIKKYAETLAQGGLAVSARKPFILSNGLLVTPANLEFSESLSKILDKLNSMTRDMLPIVTVKGPAIAPID